MPLPSYHKQRKESGTEIGNLIEFRFRRPTSAQLSRAVKADEISVLEPTQPLRLARQSKTIERLGLLSQPLILSHRHKFFDPVG